MPNKYFCKSLQNLIDSGGVNDYFEAGIQPLLDKIDVHYENISMIEKNHKDLHYLLQFQINFY